MAFERSNSGRPGSDRDDNRKQEQGRVRPFSAQDPDDTPPARETPRTVRDLIARRDYDEVSR
jgi:hypothetical protein